MKKIVYGILATLSGLVLLFSYRTSLEGVAPLSPAAVTDSSATTSSGTTSSGSMPSGSGSSVAGPSSVTPSPSPSANTATTGLSDGQYTGQAVDTRYGPVQVAITISGGMITRVDVPQYPSDNGRDQQINEYALPQLTAETTQAQSAQISMISGATYTSDGYIQSLQSALDQAKS